MATTNASISITSDIMTGGSISITKQMTMKKLQSTAGLEETTGLRTRRFTGTAAKVIIEHDEFADTKASKAYIRNTGDSKENFFYVAKHASAAASDTDGETIGKLYGQDWMLIPYAADVNITVAPSTADVMTLEWRVFIEDYA